MVTDPSSPETDARLESCRLIVVTFLVSPQPLSKARDVTTIDPKAIFAANLRRIRVLTGFSQEALADRAGLHRTYISSIERRQRNVSIENIFLLAEALGVEPGDLLKPVQDKGTG